MSFALDKFRMPKLGDKLRDNAEAPKEVVQEKVKKIIRKLKGNNA